MNPHQVIDWTDERMSELREMAKTMSAGQIAMKWSVNRNVICGKMARLGIKRPVAPPNPRRELPAPVPRLVARLRSRDDGDGGHQATFPPQMPRQAPAEATHESFPEGADIWQLTNSTCRYPLWRDSEPISQKFYCGNKAVEGAVYCDCHARIAFSGWAPATSR
jgi:hypothetical protein